MSQENVESYGASWGHGRTDRQGRPWEMVHDPRSSGPDRARRSPDQRMYRGHAGVARSPRLGSAGRIEQRARRAHRRRGQGRGAVRMKAKAAGSGRESIGTTPRSTLPRREQIVRLDYNNNKAEALEAVAFGVGDVSGERGARAALLRCLCPSRGGIHEQAVLLCPPLVPGRPTLPPEAEALMNCVHPELRVDACLFDQDLPRVSWRGARLGIEFWRRPRATS